MGNFFTTPLLFWAGLIGVALPILIHLLNKRRFRRVDWAAMDFLLEAQKINKRRVKLEDFILLLLRCLIMALLGMFLARPFFTSDAGGLFKSARHERVILLDDSLSMNAKSGGTTPLTEAGKAVTNWITTLASNNTGDSFTLVLASRPDRAVYRDEPLTEDAVNQILEDIKRLDVADATSQMPKALSEIEEMLDPSANGGTSVNRIVYVVSDFRSRDWAPEAQKEVFASLKRISEESAGLYLVDAAPSGSAGSADNVVVEEVAVRDKALIAGVPTEFEVTVRNRGRAAVTDLAVRLTAGEMLPIERVIDRVGPGEKGAASFTFTFSRPEDLSLIEPVRLKAEIAPSDGDGLADDNTRYFPARVTQGLRVLLIDGDPSSSYGESETFFMQKALSPRGRAISGLDLTVVDDSELETLPLVDYEVIYLSNVYRLAEGARQRLEDWVEAGGGLVVVLGDQIDEESYNNDLFNEGEGLLPMALTGIQGDEEGNEWALVEPQDVSHPVLKLFDGDGSPLLAGVKVFQWWGNQVDQEALESGQVAVLASLSNSEKTPLIVESGFGNGRVMMVTSALDLDWGNWPTEAVGYLIMLQELTRHMAPQRAGEGVFPVGGSLVHGLELTEFRPDGSVITPGGSSLPVRALPKAGGEQSTNWEVRFEDTPRRGFYEIELMPTDGGEPEGVLFAANVDTSEGALERVDLKAVEGAMGESPVEIVVASASLMDLGATKSRTEFWRWALYLLLAFLCVELIYGWWLGARR